MRSRIRKRVSVRGVVQGVGFRPFVHHLAVDLGLAGTVRNDASGVTIEVEGDARQVARFVRSLSDDAPPLADVLAVDTTGMLPKLDRGFVILPSGEGRVGRASVPPDVAVCDRCLAELFDPADRRYRYPFINCTDCGPRYTILDSVPYDRARTSMSRFMMCPACQAEYDDPASRRFHAQPNACPVCGPRVRLLDGAGREVEAADPVAEAVAMLARGQIVAVRGPGGFHLACDAASAEAVDTLRRRKRRPHKPLAAMARDVEAARALARISDPELRELTSWRRPIVLLQPAPGSPLVPPVVGSSPLVGVMLPYTPLQHLLMTGPFAALVMTSGNLVDEPIVCRNDEALQRLGPLADALLVHDLQTRQRADDSVVAFIGGAPVPLRRSRGYVPRPLPLPVSAPAVSAVGGDLKCVPCVARGGEAVLGQHVGDLQHPRAIELAGQILAHLQRLCRCRPHLVAHDLHPDYHATHLAIRVAGELGAETLAVQHHHAHALACLADNGRGEPALAVVLDGHGHGADGGAWGGEVLAVDGLHFERLAHLRPLPLPGGDRAARQPWRMALAALDRAFEGAIPGELAALPPFHQADAARVAGVRQLLESPGQCAETSSAGRLFDAMSSLLDLCHNNTFEGQAAIDVQGAAMSAADAPRLPYLLDESGQGPLLVDLLPAVAEIGRRRATGVAAPPLALGFHETLAAALTGAVVRARAGTGLSVVALSGGVMCNALLARVLTQRLRHEGFEILAHRQVPPNDGGLALGQALAASLHLSGAGGGSI